MIRVAQGDPDLLNCNHQDSYLDGVEDATNYLLQKIREREIKHA